LDEAPEEHREVLRAARALLDTGVDQEDVIYRTIVCGAWAGADPEFRRMRNSVVDAGESGELWKKMQNRFWNAFDSLEPWRVQDRVMLIRRPPVDALVMQTDDKRFYEEVLIEVRDRSATGEDVAAHYERCLALFGLSYVAGRAVFAYYATEGPLQVLARPEREPTLHPFLKHEVRIKEEQGKFPDPQDVGHFYEMLRAKGYPTGREGGSSPKPHNLIPACAAWYLGGREALAAEEAKERRRLLADAEARINEYLPALPIKTRSTLKRDIEAASQRLEEIEAEVNAGRHLLNANLDDS
jgi:hypothetical protein